MRDLYFAHWWNFKLLISISYIKEKYENLIIFGHNIFYIFSTVPKSK